MNVNALLWAGAQKPHRSSDKFVLLAIAWNADTNATFRLPINQLCIVTLLTRQTVWKSLRRLVKAKLIRDTGERTGHTRGVKIYQLTGHIDTPTA